MSLKMQTMKPAKPIPAYCIPKKNLTAPIIPFSRIGAISMETKKGEKVIISRQRENDPTPSSSRDTAAPLMLAETIE